MSYFSRLTDIVTCNLSDILAAEDDPQAAIRTIIAEMEEGLAGARRSVNTSAQSEERMRKELDEIREQVAHWAGKARDAIVAGDENQARLALMRKQESEDVIAGLDQQHQAAQTTSEHLSTTQRALEARLSDARRKLQQLDLDVEEPILDQSASIDTAPSATTDPRSQQIEDELAALKRELNAE